MNNGHHPTSESVRIKEQSMRHIECPACHKVWWTATAPPGPVKCPNQGCQWYPKKDQVWIEKE